MTNCPKFVEMQKMFHGKVVTITKVQPIVETQIVIIDVNVVDVPLFYQIFDCIIDIIYSLICNYGQWTSKSSQNVLT